ncbi:MAG: hypothetical protein ABR920_17735, partial [Terriglobales bacterium]
MAIRRSLFAIRHRFPEADVHGLCQRFAGGAVSLYSCLFTLKVLTLVLPNPPSPRSFGIIGLGGNSRQVFEFKGLIGKVFHNQRLRLSKS